MLSTANRAAVMLGMAMGFRMDHAATQVNLLANLQQPRPRKYTHDQNYHTGKSNPLRGYYNKYSHCLSELGNSKRLSKSKFQGFRTKRGSITGCTPLGNLVTMSVWVRA